MSKTPFSKRHGYTGQPKEITVRDDAPANLRYFELAAANDLSVGPHTMREVTSAVLQERPDPNNWSEGNVWSEAESNTYGCEWFQVYDIIEGIWGYLSAANEKVSGESNESVFSERLNDFFVEKGIGWQLVDGEIITRGAEAFEEAVETAKAAFEESARATAAKHIHEALQALSRRPEPDFPGAIYHAMGSLECLARDVVGDQKATLGEILKRHPGLIPTPLDKALSQVWGYASNEARHVEEGREPQRDETELLVGLAASTVTYLCRKTQIGT
jgi:hypothetical protein